MSAIHNASRISSILRTEMLATSITGLDSFNLDELQIEGELDATLPENRRLGHLAESVVSEAIKSSLNFELLYENVQLIKGKITIGELDFIVRNLTNHEVIHVELAYKFYLLDPTLSSDFSKNWIGPNRNDSLVEKLAKLKNKQFPLLQSESAQKALVGVDVHKTSQAVCFLASLFVPYNFRSRLDPAYEKAIVGHHLDFNTFQKLNKPTKEYYIPSKKEWGIDPAENSFWQNFEQVQQHIQQCLFEKQAPLCWQKDGDKYSVFFIVWW